MFASLLQSEGDECVGDRPAASDARAAGCRNDYVLLAVLAHVGDRRGMAARRQLHHPKLLPGLRIECPESLVVGGADENEAACRRDAAAEITCAGLDALLAEIGVLLIDAE